MKFSISEISNDDISGTGRPINFVFDLGTYCQQQAKHIAYTYGRLS